MISKSERERDKAICEAATPGPLRWWTSNSHRRLRSDSVPRDVAYGTKHRDGVDDIVISEQDMAAIENAVNRLPAYIAAAEEMERRIAEIEAEAELVSYSESFVDGIRYALRILRGGQ